MDKIEAMQRFIMVAQSGSFTKAANILDLPKSSISSAIQTLEKELGTRLFHRSTRSVTLTQDGITYLPQCQNLIAELDAMQSQFQRHAKDIKGVLRIDMPSRFASTVILPNLPTFLKQYPNLKIKISSADYRVDLIKEGIDCIIRVGELDDSALIARPLTHYHSLNCVSPAYIEQFGTPHSLEDLAQHKLIDYNHTLGNTEACFEYIKNNKTYQHRMPSSVSVNGTDTYLSACLSGLGIAQIPTIGVKKFLKDGSLISILPEYEAEPMLASLVYSSRRQPPKRLLVFIEWLQTLSLKLEQDI